MNYSIGQRKGRAYAFSSGNSGFVGQHSQRTWRAAKSKDLYRPEEIGMWNMVIAVLEWVNGAENPQIEEIKSGK